MTIPNLSLTSGPAISGGPTSSGGGSTGDFHYNNSSWQETAAKMVPLVLVAGVALWLWKR